MKIEDGRYKCKVTAEVEMIAFVKYINGELVEIEEDEEVIEINDFEVKDIIY